MRTVTDEKYVFVSDVIDKKRTARGSHNKRTHCGRGGSVRLPSDNMTRKELNKMNGDVKSYRMNDPMTWEEFKSMPDDLRITYIKLLREKFHVSDTKIGEMLGVAQRTISSEISRLGIGLGKRHKHTGFDKDVWEAWRNRTITSAHDVLEEIQPVEVENEPCEAQNTTDDTEGENYSPVQTLTLADREVMWRALGVIEGLSCGVCNERIREGLVSAIEKISDVMNGSGV